MAISTIKTRKVQGGFQWTHYIEFDFTNLTDEQKNELMEASAAIRWQARARKFAEKALDDLAKLDVVKVEASELFERAAAVVDPLKVADKLNDEQAMALLAELQKRLGVTKK